MVCKQREKPGCCVHRGFRLIYTPAAILRSTSIYRFGARYYYSIGGLFRVRGRMLPPVPVRWLMLERGMAAVAGGWLLG